MDIAFCYNLQVKIQNTTKIVFLNTLKASLREYYLTFIQDAYCVALLNLQVRDDYEYLTLV